MSDEFECSYKGLAHKIGTGTLSGALIGSIFDGLGIIPGATLGAGAGASKWLINKAFFCQNDSMPNPAVNNLPPLEFKDTGK